MSGPAAAAGPEAAVAGYRAGRRREDSRHLAWGSVAEECSWRSGGWRRKRPGEKAGVHMDTREAEARPDGRQGPLWGCLVEGGRRLRGRGAGVDMTGAASLWP